MPYAIVQKSLVPPDADKVLRAFRAVPSLTDYDAALMTKDAFGILVGKLELAEAGRLLQALCAEGVEAEMVDEKSLPQLPPPRPVHRAEPTPEAFVAYDLLDHPDPIEWPHILLIAAGAVELTEFEHKTKVKTVTTQYVASFVSGYTTAVPMERVEHFDKEEQRLRLILELFLDREPGRYQIRADKFNYAYLGERLDERRERNYFALLQDVLRHATDSALNRGASAQQQDPSQILQYPSRHAFEEESIWILWRYFGAGRNVG